MFVKNQVGFVGRSNLFFMKAKTVGKPGTLLSIQKPPFRSQIDAATFKLNTD